MVLLITTPAIKAAVDEFLRLRVASEQDEALQHDFERLGKADLDGPIDHSDLIKISKWLIAENNGSDVPCKAWRLDALLRGTSAYKAPPPPKPEPVGRPPCHPSRRILTL